MTKEECAIIMAYTGYVMLRNDDLKFFYEYITKIIGRPVWTHELADMAEEIQEKSRQDYNRLCSEAVPSADLPGASKWNTQDDLIPRAAAIDAIADNVGRMHGTPKEAMKGVAKIWLEGIPGRGNGDAG